MAVPCGAAPRMIASMPGHVRVRGPQLVFLAPGHRLVRLLRAGLLLVVQAFDLVALELPGCCPGQVLHPDVEAEDALVVGERERQALDVEPDDLAEIDDAPLAHHIDVRHHHRVKPLGGGLAGQGDAEDAELLDEGRLCVVRFDLFRVDVLPGRQDDDLLLAARDDKPAPAVEVAEIAGVEPAAGESHGVDVGPVVVARHHDRAANQDLAVLILAVVGSARVGCDADLHAVERRAHGVHVRIADARGRGGPGAFGQAVRLNDVETHAEEIAADHRIETGPAAHHDAHAAPDGLVGLAEQQPAEIDPGVRPQPGVQGDQRLEREAGRKPRRGHALGDPLVEQVVELRDDTERRDAPLGKGPHHLGAVHGFQEHDSRPRRQREQQVGNLRERVEERQDGENGVTLIDPDHAERAKPLRAEVAVRQHHALRVACGARRVQHDGGVGFSGGTGRQGRRRWTRDRRYEARDARRRAGEQEQVRPGRHLGHGLSGGLEEPRRCHDGLRIAVTEHRADLRHVVRRVERDCHRAEAEDAQVGHEPAVVVFGEDRAAIARAKPEA